MPDHCPKSDEISAMTERVRSMENQLNDLRKYVIANAEARIFASGLEEGKKISDTKLYKAINIAVIFLGSVFLLLIIGLFMYLMIGAEHTLAFFRMVLKIMGL